MNESWWVTDSTALHCTETWEESGDTNMKPQRVGVEWSGVEGVSEWGTTDTYLHAEGFKVILCYAGCGFWPSSIDQIWTQSCYDVLTSIHYYYYYYYYFLVVLLPKTKIKGFVCSSQFKP